VGADTTSICSDTFFLVGNANLCPLPPDRTFSNIGFSTTATQRHRATAITEQHGSQRILLDFPSPLDLPRHVVLPFPVTYRTVYQDMEAYRMDYPSQRRNGVSLL